MIEPLLADDSLLADIAAADSQTDSFHLWWLGQSGFLVKWGESHLLLDPYLSDSLTKKYAQTDKPHIRMTRIPIAPERLNFIGAITSSHNHTDHLDAETLIPLLSTNPGASLLTPAANQAFAADRLRIPLSRITPLDAGQRVTVGEFTICAVPAAHESLERDEQGRSLYLGYVVEFGRFAIYHSGDCVPYEGQAELLRNWRLDLALLPINGRAPERRVSGNFWGHEAAELAHKIGARCAVPCHYEMFTFNTATPDEFERACRQLGQPHHVLRCGERLSL